MQNFFTKLDSPQSGSAPGVGPSSSSQSDAPWWLRYGSKIIGVLAGIGAIVLGVWSAISFTAICIVSGIWLVCAGVLTLVCEAPFCFSLAGVKVLTNLYEKIEGRPSWARALFYLILSIPPIFMCSSWSIIVGAGFIFVTGVLYGLQFLGKKAPQATMMTRATSDHNNLVENENQFP